jgi:hypothetical protein
VCTPNAPTNSSKAYAQRGWTPYEDEMRKLSRVELFVIDD